MKAMEYDIGNTHIEIWDDYIINDLVKVQEILDRVGLIGMNSIISEQENSLDRAATLTKAM